ncbi:hypothetical protein IHE44_0014166, partial [Lamprotornis superbus]
ILECLDLSERRGNRVLQILPRHLRSECRERCCLALKALLELTDDSSMTKKMCSLTGSLVELLRDRDGEIVTMTVMVLSFIVLEKDMLIPSPIALQLAESLLPLFDHASSHLNPVQPMLRSFFLPFIQDNSQVQLVSILLFRTLVTLLMEKEKKALKQHVQQSLLPLFFHCQDKNRHVAE